MRFTWILPLCFVAASACAQHAPNSFDMTYNAGSVDFDDDRNYINRAIVSMGLGYHVNPAWGVEALIGNTNTKDKTDRTGRDGFYYLGDVVYHFFPRHTVVPILFAGAGMTTIDRRGGDSKSSFALQAGGGVKWFFTKRWGARFDARAVHQSNKDDVILNLGLQLSWSLPHHQAKHHVAKALEEDLSAITCHTDQACNDRDHHHSIALDVKFAFDSADIVEAHEDEIKDVATFMSAHPEVTVTLVGHTDNVGSEAYNERLGLERASAVRRVLLTHHQADASHLKVRAEGESAPMAGNDTQAGRALNRRVTIELTH